MRRRTIARPVGPICGIGVRTGQQMCVRLSPSDAGLQIHRTDIDRRIPLHLSHTLDLPNCSAVGTGPEDATMFIEHLMATLYANAITDLLVEVGGPEVPLLDGSAMGWQQAVAEAGAEELPGTVEPLVVGESIHLQDGERWIRAEPAKAPVFSYDLEYSHPLIRRQVASFSPESEDFSQLVARARTFALIEELQQAQAAGLLKGGSEDNCRVIYPDRYSEAPTVPLEFARHKLLDMLGDMYLLSRPVIGSITGYRTGHQHNRELLRRLGRRG